MELSMEHPEQLLWFEHGKIVINSELLSKLEGLNGKVSVIAVAGKYRSGKSYLLNRFVGKSDGFAVGSRVHAQTRGVWLWACKHPYEKNVHLILLDTEGISGAMQNDDDDDDEQATKLFSLTVLISSELVYNISKNLDAAILEDLEKVAELGKHIKAFSKEKDGQFLSLINPVLRFVIRDFHLILENVDGTEMTEQEYLEQCLTLKKRPRSSMDKQSNNVKMKIRYFFPKRYLYTLPLPVQGKEKLQSLYKLHEDDIDENFKKESEDMIEEILKECTKFTIFSGEMNMKGWIESLKMHVDSLNNNKIPCIEQSAQFVRQGINISAEDRALGEFNDIMSNIMPLLPMSSAELSVHIEEAVKKVMEIYFENSFQAVANREDEGASKFLRMLKLKVKEIWDMNGSMSTQTCKKLLEKKFFSLIHSVTEGYYRSPITRDKYYSDLVEAKSNYEHEHQKGPMKHKELGTTLKRINEMENMLKAHIKKTVELIRIAEEKHQEEMQQIESKMRKVEEMMESKHKEQMDQQKKQLEKLLRSDYDDTRREYERLKHSHPFEASVFEEKLSRYNRVFGCAIVGAVAGGVIGGVAAGPIGAVGGAAVGAFVGGQIGIMMDDKLSSFLVK